MKTALLATLLVLASALAGAPRGLALTFPSPPFDFAGAAFDGRPGRLDPGHGSTPTPLLVVFIPLTELTPGAGSSSVGYDAYPESWFFDRIFGIGPVEASDPATWIGLASRGLFQWLPAKESFGASDNGIVFVAPQAPGAVPGGCNSGRLAMELADSLVDFSVFDTTGLGNADGKVDSTELSLLVLVGNGGSGAQACGVANPGTPLDGVTFEGLWAAVSGGPNLSTLAATPNMVHELFHARFSHADLYGTGIGSMGIMGTTVGESLPRGPTAWTRLALGWADLQIAQTDGWYDLARADESGDVLLVYDPSHGTDEYFLLENRVADPSDVDSIDQSVPDSGVYVTAMNLAQWSSPKSVPEFMRVIQPTGNRAAPGCRYWGNLTTAATPGQTQLVVDEADFPPGLPYQVRIANQGELDEVVVVSSITDTTLTLSAPLTGSHGVGAKVEWRGPPWFGYFAGNLLAGADSGDSSFQISTPGFGGLPVDGTGAVLPGTRVRIYYDTDNPYLAKDPDDYALTAVSSDGSTWSVMPNLVRDYPAGSRMSEGWKGSCRGLDDQSAWDVADTSTPATRHDFTWADGSDSGFRLLGVGPAAERTRVYIDLPERNGLFNGVPYVIEPPSWSTASFEVPWETEFTGTGAPAVLLEVHQADGTPWLETVGNPTTASPWLTQWLGHDGSPPDGLSVDYTLTVPANSSFDEAGTIPVDWPFSPQGSLGLSPWTATGPPPVLPAGFGPGRAFEMEARSAAMRFGTRGAFHQNSFVTPGVPTALLPPGFPSFPICGEAAVDRFEDPAGNETKVMAETALTIDVEPHHGFENHEDRLRLDPSLSSELSDGQYPLRVELSCPAGSFAHVVRLEPRATERLQRYEYEMSFRQRTHFFPEPVNGLGDILRLNGQPARSAACEGGFFPRCQTNEFGEIFIVLPPALAGFGPPGCPAGCPNHYVTVMSDAFPYLDMTFSVPPGTLVDLLDAFGNVAASSFPVALAPSVPQPLWASAPETRDGTSDGSRGGEGGGVEGSGSATDATSLIAAGSMAAASTADATPVQLALVERLPDAPTPVYDASIAQENPSGPASPFIANAPAPVLPRDTLRLISQGPAGTYYLRVTLPPGWSAADDPEPISVSYVTFDRDADGFFDGQDNCPDVAQADQADKDADGYGDACDNCVFVQNDQKDIDGDAQGDVCDADRDGDGLDNAVETGTGQYGGPNDTGTSPDVFDSDGDGLGDGDEVQNGFDPTDPNSPGPTPPPVPLLGPLGVSLLALAMARVGARRMRRRQLAGRHLKENTDALSVPLESAGPPDSPRRRLARVRVLRGAPLRTVGCARIPHHRERERERRHRPGAVLRHRVRRGLPGVDVPLHGRAPRPERVERGGLEAVRGAAHDAGRQRHHHRLREPGTRLALRHRCRRLGRRHGLGCSVHRRDHRGIFVGPPRAEPGRLVGRRALHPSLVPDRRQHVVRRWVRVVAVVRDAGDGRAPDRAAANRFGRRRQHPAHRRPAALRPGDPVHRGCDRADDDPHRAGDRLARFDSGGRPLRGGRRVQHAHTARVRSLRRCRAHHARDPAAEFGQRRDLHDHPRARDCAAARSRTGRIGAEASRASLIGLSGKIGAACAGPARSELSVAARPRPGREARPPAPGPSARSPARAHPPPPARHGPPRAPPASAPIPHAPSLRGRASSRRAPPCRATRTPRARVRLRRRDA